MGNKKELVSNSAQRKIISNNERISALVIGKIFHYQVARHGIDGEEADWIFDNKHKYEITLILDECLFSNKNTSSNSFAKTFKEILIKRIKAKATKKYINREINLCLVSVTPVFSLVLPKTIDDVFSTLRTELLAEIKVNSFLDVFKNIYILMPFDSSWVLVDLFNYKYYSLYVGSSFKDPNNYAVTKIEL